MATKPSPVARSSPGSRLLQKALMTSQQRLHWPFWGSSCLPMNSKALSSFFLWGLELLTSTICAIRMAR